MTEKTPLQANRDYAEAKLWHWAENRDLAFPRRDYPSVSVTWRMIHEGESAHECEDCGEAIPAARREAIAGCTLCVDCQNEQERRA